MKPPENGITIVGETTTYYLEGKVVTEEEYRVVYPLPEAGVPAAGGAWNRPLRSDALGIHPAQVDEANTRNAARGCSVTYDRQTGEAIIPDRGERKKLLKIERMHDRDGGYGDG